MSPVYGGDYARHFTPLQLLSARADPPDPTGPLIDIEELDASPIDQECPGNTPSSPATDTGGPA